jgi:hypothetical protein
MSESIQMLRSDCFQRNINSQLSMLSSLLGSKEARIELKVAISRLKKRWEVHGNQ